MEGGATVRAARGSWTALFEGWLLKMAKIDALLRMTSERGCSDLHLKAGTPPAVRLDAHLRILRDLAVLTPEDTSAMAREMIAARDLAGFEAGDDVDLAYSLDGVGRFRINVFQQQGSVSIAARRVSMERRSFEELTLPPVIESLANETRGLVLVTGTAGSGKTTTLAAMIDYINHSRDGHIVTIEDPIEVVHEDALCVIDQREIGIDTPSYADALRHVVRQDPDVILIGEMRDPETVSAALTAAEIGNLVLSTLHTVDATETINRIIDFYPPHQQRQARLMLAATLRGVVSMRLLPAIGGGLVPAVEVLVMTGTIREYILDAEQTYRIRDAMGDGEYYGMQSFDQSLIELLQAGRITVEDATATSANAHDFRIKLRQIGVIPPPATTAY
jgi:twitching motility protein PilT